MVPLPSWVTVSMIKSSHFSAETHLNIICNMFTPLSTLIWVFFSGGQKGLCLDIFHFGFMMFIDLFSWGSWEQHTVCVHSCFYSSKHSLLRLLDTDVVQLCEGNPSLCCYSNHDYVAVVAKLFCKISKLWVLVFACTRHYTCFGCNKLTFSRQGISEEFWKCHFLWKWEQLLLPRAPTVKRLFLLSYILIVRHLPATAQYRLLQIFFLFPLSSLLVKKHTIIPVC